LSIAIILHVTWAKTFYLALVFAVLYFLYKRHEKKFKMQQVKHEEEQRRLSYVHDLELSKTESELVALRNEKLETEIDFKNAELASSAMHLVKKGELFTKIKNEMVHVMKGLENPQAISGLKKMIKHLRKMITWIKSGRILQNTLIKCIVIS